MNRVFILVAAISVLLQGCKTQPVKTEPVQLEPVSYQAGEFNRESLYALMLAEIAGQRRMFPVALENYIVQAEKTRDPTVAERATRIAQYLRDSEKIVTTARLWREVAPHNPEPYQIEASMLLHQNQYQAALPLIEKALDYDSLRTLALLRSQSNQIKKNVLASYIRMLEDFHSNAEPRADLELTLALLYKQAGQKQQALNAFNRALSIEPENAETLIQKAELLRTEQDLNGALELIHTAFEQQPENRQLQILYTQLLFQTKQPKLGVEQAKSLLEKNLKDHQLTYYLALLMLENEEIDAAETALKRLFTLKPEDSSPHFYLGHIAQSRDEDKVALKHYIAVKNGPNVMQALSQASGLLSDVTDKPKLQQILSDARTRLPKQAPQIFTLEAEWLNLHNFSDEAFTLLEDALQDYEGDTTLLYTRAMMIESSDFAQAEKDLRAILNKEPNNSTVQNALGYTLLLHTERYEEALDLIQAALNQEPEDPAILDSMGWVLHKLSRSKEALPYLEKAHALYSDPEVTGHLIQVYWAIGQKERAERLLASSRKEHPDNPFLEEAAEAIAQ